MSNPLAANRTQLSTEERIIEVIGWTLNVPSSQIFPYTHLKDDLFLDPIDLMLLIIKLETQFNVYLTPEEVAKIETVRDATHFIRKYAEA